MLCVSEVDVTQEILKITDGMGAWAAIYPVGGSLLPGLVATTPSGRLGTPEDLASAARFPASDDSAYVNGI